MRQLDCRAADGGICGHELAQQHGNPTMLWRTSEATFTVLICCHQHCTVGSHCPLVMHPEHLQLQDVKQFHLYSSLAETVVVAL